MGQAISKTRRSSLLPLLIGVGTLAGVILAVAVAVVVSLSQVDRAEVGARHARDIVIASNDALRAMIDQETGLRGYILTTDPTFLEPYDSGGGRLAEAMAKLSRLSRDDPPQRARVKTLTGLAADWRNLTAAPEIAVIRAGRPAAARVGSASEKRQMDRIRGLIASIRTAEKAVTAADDSAGDRAFARARQALLLGCLAGLPIAGFVVGRGFWILLRSRRNAQDSRDFLETVIDSMPAGITVKDAATGRLLMLNPATEELYGVGRGVNLGKTGDEIFSREQAARFAAQDREVIESGETRTYDEVPVETARGVRFLRRKKMLIHNADGPDYLLSISEDVTERKLAGDALKAAVARAEAASEAKSTFLANMSHELRTPLTSITGFSRLMEDRTDLPGEARHFTRRIRDASEALLSIINDVLDFSKLEAGQVELERQPLSVRRLVEDAAGLLTVQAAAKDVALKVEIDDATPPQVLGDVARLRQVVLNLLSNAVKFTGEGSVTVAVAYAPGTERLRLTVTDTGPGIPAEALGRLFERFSQAEVSINRTHGGTGLGLAISRGIVDLMGGEIGVETDLGRGSSFWFEVPAPPAEAEAAYEAESSAEMDCRPLRLLLVDDTAVNRELVRLMLAPFGFHIEEAGGGAEGVQAAMSTPFDLILMDVRMPGVDGLEATRVIRGASQVNRRTPILALTADVQPENAAACRSAGMDDVLAKPIVPQQLISKIMHWANGADAESAVQAAG